MAPRREQEPQHRKPRRRPASTPEARENQVISMAVDLAEQMIRDGTASSQVLTHFLKLGSTRERLEQQRLEHEIELMKVKAEAAESAKRVESMYADALNAMRTYSGLDHQNTKSDEDDEYDR